MTSAKPYLIRAFNDWILDNQLTPYLVVDSKMKNVSVPKEYIQKDGTIVFNVTPGIVNDLQITNEFVAFDARFSARKRHIFVPVKAVQAIYAKENGQGMSFEPEMDDDKDDAQDSAEPQVVQDINPIKPKGKGKPNLKIVK